MIPMSQPNNEVIISELAEAKKYLRTVLNVVNENNATVNTMHRILEAINIIDTACIQPDRHESIGMAIAEIRRGREVEIDLPDEIKEAILAEVKKRQSEDSDTSN